MDSLTKVLQNARPEQLQMAQRSLSARQQAEQEMLARNKKKSTGIGSIAGGIIGGVAGTALGPVGTIGGGALGSAAGEALEQFITGGDVDAGDVAREGAFGAAGGVAGKVLGAGGKLLARGAGKAAVEGAEQVGKTTTRGKLTEAGNKALASQYGTISKPVAREADLVNTVGKLANAGITKPQDAERVAGAFTGSDGLVTKAVRGAVGDAGQVDHAGIRNLAQDLLVNEQVPGTKGKTFMKFLDVQLNKLAGTKGSLGNADPNDIMEVIRRLETKSAEMLGKGGTYHLATTDDKALAKVHQLVADELKDRLYSQANPNLSKVLTPQLREELVNLMPGNKQWAQHVDDTVMKSGDIGQLRSSMAPFVKISKAIGEADINAPTFGGRVGNTFTKQGVLDRIASSEPVANATGRALRFAGGAPALPGASAMARIPGGVGTTAAQTVGQVGTRAAAGAMNPQEDMSRLVPVDGSESQVMEDPAGEGTPEAGLTPEALRQMAIEDVNTTGGQNLDKIKQLQALMESTAPKSEKVDTNTKKELLKLNTARGVADKVSQQLEAVGSTGRLIGAAKGIAGGAGFNAKAKVYEDFRKSALANIAKAVGGETGTLTDQDIKRIDGMLPKITDTAEESQMKLANLYDLINEREAYVTAIGGGGDDAMLVQQ